MKDTDKRFAVSLSFAGEKREFVENVAHSLAERFGREHVLYDRYHEPELSKLNLDVSLPNLYKDQSELIVIFLSREYTVKRWCGLEWRAVRSLIQTNSENMIMLVSFEDHGDLSDIGIYPGDGYLSIRSRSPREIAELILERHEIQANNQIGSRPYDGILDNKHTQRDFIGEQRNSLLKFFAEEWLRKNPSTAMIQGIPGAGKTQLAIDIAMSSGYKIAEVSVGMDLLDNSEEILLKLASQLSLLDINELDEELKLGANADLMSALKSVLQRYRVLVIIDDFQNLKNGKDAALPNCWKHLVESVNDSKFTKGKLLLISNRKFQLETWNEKCITRTLEGLTESESVALLNQLLTERNCLDAVPEFKRGEIGRRLGGNPRAIKTLVGALASESLEELMEFVPNVPTSSEDSINSQLLEQFEVGIINRSLQFSDSNLINFLRRISVYRRTFKADAIDGKEKLLRNELIDRFLLDCDRGNYLVHPLAREISISRLRDDGKTWVDSHGIAADYYLKYFHTRVRGSTKNLTHQYLELRYHLHESNRMHDLAIASCKLRDFALSSISPSRLTMVPRDTLILEERIALIRLIDSEQRTKRLEYHLALCLKARNVGSDYKDALEHAWRSIGPNSYYAYWILLVELEYAINGIRGLRKAYASALENLDSQSNLSEIYILVADLYDKSNKTIESIDVLRRAVVQKLPSGKDAIIRKCAEQLKKIGREDEAIELVRQSLADEDIEHRGVLFRYCADLHVEFQKHTEAIGILKQGIRVPKMSYLVHLYLKLSDVLELVNKREDALKCLREGLSDGRVKHKDKLHRRIASILEDDNDRDALVALESSINNTVAHQRVPLYHSYVAMAERCNRTKDAISIMECALRNPVLAKQHSLYLCYSNIYFRSRDLTKAISVLRRALNVRDLLSRFEIIQKLADLLMRIQKPDEAITILKEAQEDSSMGNRFQLLKKHSEILEKTGRVNEAIELNRDAINSPALKNRAVVYQTYAKLLYKHGDPDSAIEILKKALALPDLSGRVIIYQEYANILGKLKRFDEGVELLEMALNGPKIGNIVSLYKLCGELAYKAGDTQRSIEVLKRGIQLHPKDESLTKVLAIVSS